MSYELFFENEVKARTANQDTVCVEFYVMTERDSLSQEENSDYNNDSPMWHARYDPRIEKCVRGWAQQYESAEHLRSCDDATDSLEDALMRMGDLDGPIIRASVTDITTSHTHSVPAPPSLTTELDRQAAELQELNEWVDQSKQKYPSLWANPKDKKRLETMIGELKRKILGKPPGRNNL